jgi:hypothetical protein
MESKLRNSVSASREFKDAIDSSVIGGENLCKETIVTNMSEIDNNLTKNGCNFVKSENGVNFPHINESVISNEKEQTTARFVRKASPPPTKLIGDDGRTIIVKDVSAKKDTSCAIRSPNKHVTKDKDSDSGIGCMSSERNKSWLLRLFESKLFDASMAISYMFNSKEPGMNTI